LFSCKHLQQVMGPDTTMNGLSHNSNSDSTTLGVPKLRDDGSNWADYQPRIRKAMGAKGLWRHVEGTAVAPVPYPVTAGVAMLSDGKTPATEEQIEAKESKSIEFEKREYLAQHIILSTTSARLGAKIKDLTTAEDMWKKVTDDATSRSTLFLLDAEDQLSSMKLGDNDDSKAHLTELKQHFQLMLQRRDNLLKMGSTISDARFNIIVMSSLPETYRPTLQTITAAERASKLSGGTSQKMTPDDLIAFIIEEAQHRVINDERTKNAESALAARTRKPEKSKKKGKGKGHDHKSDEKCENCGGTGHGKPDCWSKGGGKEGQGPRQKKGKGKSKQPETAVVAVEDDDNDLFAFTCTSDFAAVAEGLDLPKSKLGTCMDSGASRDYCPDRSKFTNYRNVERMITTADGKSLKAIGMGDLNLELQNGSKKTKMVFHNAIHAPEMAFTLISISRLDKGGYSITFRKGMCTINNPKSKTIATIPHSDGLYKIVASKSAAKTETANTASTKISISEAHKRLGHISHAAIKHAVSNGLITGIDLDSNSKPEFCEACAKAKSARQPFPKESKTRAQKYGEHVHWDLWGPATVKSLNGNSYAAARIDDATRETKLYFQQKKSETSQSYKKDEAYIETQTGNRIKCVRSDRGGEFLSDALIRHQDQKGTVRELTVHDSPPQNGVAERGMRTRAERARALLLSSGLPRFLWEEAMKHTTWLQNRTPASALNGKTPHEMKHKRKPDFTNVQEFGAAAYVKDLKAGKLDPRANVGRFVGYDPESKGYRIYWPGKRSITVERNVVFNKDDVQTSDETAIVHGVVQYEGEKDKIIQHPENNAIDIDKPKEQILGDQQTIEKEPELQDESNSVPFPSTPDPQDEIEPEINHEDEPQTYGRGRRVPPKPQGMYTKMHGGLVAGVAHLSDEDPLDQLPDDDEHMFTDLPPDFALVGVFHPEPPSLNEALRGPNAKQWQEALDYEINQLEKMGTWIVEDLPAGQKPIPCGEVLRTKRGPNGEVQSYRVRIVAGGHRQVEGVNYTETFSAAAKMPTVRVVLANAAQQNWEMEHIDVKSAYLNAPLEETIYMKAPRGVLKPGQEGKVLRLVKGLYGLKQAGRGWFLEMSKVFLKELGFKKSAIDHSVFYRRAGEEHTIVAVATDDMALTSKQKADAERFKSDIRKHWEITDHGPIQWFLGFEIRRDRNARTISINQRAYIESMVDKFNLTNAKPVSTPMDVGATFSIQQSPSTVNQVERMKGVPYSEAIGSVLWPVVVSRPDAAYAVGILSQFIQNPGQAHWEGVKRIIRYLGCTKDLWLTFGGLDENLVKGYCDADWASQNHRHSISGYSFHMGTGAVSWSSKKQNIVALSSTEAEYIAQTHAAKEGVWLKSFVEEVCGTRGGAVKINCDNQGAIALAKDNKFHSRTKHIDIRYHFVRESVENKKISVSYIPTNDNVADVFTKALSKPKFQRFVELLGLKTSRKSESHPISSQALPAQHAPHRQELS
jgi:hypothetical protein